MRLWLVMAVAALLFGCAEKGLQLTDLKIDENGTTIGVYVPNEKLTSRRQLEK